MPVELFGYKLFFYDRYLKDIEDAIDFKNKTEGNPRADFLTAAYVITSALKKNLEFLKWYKGWFGLRWKLKFKYIRKHINLVAAEEFVMQIKYLERNYTESSESEDYETFKKKILQEAMKTANLDLT